MTSKAALLVLSVLVAAATFDVVHAQVWDSPITDRAVAPEAVGSYSLYFNPLRLDRVGTPYASEVQPSGNGGYQYVPVTTSSKTFYIRYNKTPHHLYLSNQAIGGKDLGEVAPEEFVEGKVYKVPLASLGKYWVSDVYQNYVTTENAYLPITRTA